MPLATADVGRPAVESGSAQDQPSPSRARRENELEKTGLTLSPEVLPEILAEQLLSNADRARTWQRLMREHEYRKEEFALESGPAGSLFRSPGSCS